MRPKQVIILLEKAGYSIDHQTGSHVIMYKPGHLPVTVPRHNRDLKKGTLHQILRNAGLSVDEFLNLGR
ncbi:MAG: type II toxin-antitoxin system HicA family toxin [Armatimonadota bacterium]|nr:type II toxin-antitoxin system HicA family toxin [Armatimonadota bacterium]